MTQSAFVVTVADIHDTPVDATEYLRLIEAELADALVNLEVIDDEGDVTTAGQGSSVTVTTTADVDECDALIDEAIAMTNALFEISGTLVLTRTT